MISRKQSTASVFTAWNPYNAQRDVSSVPETGNFRNFLNAFLDASDANKLSHWETFSSSRPQTKYPSTQFFLYFAVRHKIVFSSHICKVYTVFYTSLSVRDISPLQVPTYASLVLEQAVKYFPEAGKAKPLPTFFGKRNPVAFLFESFLQHCNCLNKGLYFIHCMTIIISGCLLSTSDSSHTHDAFGYKSSHSSGRARRALPTKGLID